MEKKRKIATLNLILVERGIVEKILIPRSKAMEEEIKKSDVEAVVDEDFILLHSGDDTPVLEGGEFYPVEGNVPVEFHLQYGEDYELFTLYYSEEELEKNFLYLLRLKNKISSFLKEKLSKKCSVSLQIR